MSDLLLENIIALEKRLQRQLEAERSRAAAWQERELDALAATLAAAEAATDQLDQQALAAARVELEAQAAAMVAAAATLAERLAALDNAELEQRLRARLDAILPETGHDHPHGQG